ncbi:uncharacterized protein VICG_00806 [Vittaforma corneae ATCC 50505]|uniref:CDC20/Fizzy WD40 domain-containing protein n=1 Tax=Vittaforma corneae (strain ATCC 50505) TaxID=993615 RepID=L2GMP6_VITCO|nr:uncharacterized protein VICG_00806 [Vittaforma corneae ATCC 50505]ELA42163.1 hypothetical protein VICG_00806 [Vittaforma corneae ATCC 50505]
MAFDHLDIGGIEKNDGFRNSFIFALPTIKERSKRIEERIVDTCPFKILDAPGLIDDYYLNLLDWTGNRIAIALGDTVYCYDVNSKEVMEVYSSPSSYISSLKGFNNVLAIGDSKGQIHLYDFEKGQIVDRRIPHSTRVCSIAFSDKIMSSGEKTGKISNLDLRSSIPSYLSGHTQEVCGLKWSPNNEYLASGSNDNTVRIWKSGSPISRVLKGHESAVKALDWCPWRVNVLATGGGTKDKSIKFWDVDAGKTIRSVEMNSQVCSLIYCSKYKEIITGHGFQENDLKLWRASDMKLISQFGMHESRVLHMALSNDQCTLVSLGADESLKFWKIAEPPAKEYKRDSIGLR